MYVVAEWSIVSNVERVTAWQTAVCFSAHCEASNSFNNSFTKPVLWTNQKEATERSVQEASTFLVTQEHIK